MQEHLIVENLVKSYKNKKKEISPNLFRTSLFNLGINVYEQNTILNNISLTIKRGDIVGLIGPNGAGKTTLLKCISDVTAYESGSIKKHVNTISIINLTFGFDQNDSVITCIRSTLLLLGLSAPSSDIIKSILKWSNLEDHRDKFIHNLSTGMKMRLALGIIFHSEAECLLFDEVLAVGDVTFKNQIVKEIIKFTKKGGSIVLVSHDLDFIRENATRVIYLDQNKIIYDGNVFDGIERYLINYGFFEFGKKFLENRLTSGPVSFGFVGPINKSFDYVELFTSHEPLMIGVEISSIERVQIQINFDLYCNDNLVSGYRGLPFCIEKTSDHSLKFSETIDTLNLNSGNYYSRISVFIKDINDKNIYLPLKITTKPFKVFANNILDEFLEYNGWAYPNTFVQLRSNLSIMRDK